MVKLTRERVALVVFFALVIAGALILLSYFSTGRGWSVAATVVDDSMGQMDSYTAIVYSGVAEPAPEESDDAAPSSPACADDAEDPDKVTGLGLRLLTLAAEVDGADEGRVYVSDVRDIYEKRGARVLTLDLADNASRYADPIVFDVQGKKIGVFSVKERLPLAEFRQIVDELREDGAESVICITPRPSLICDYAGIDVALVTQGAHEYAIQNDPDDETVIATSPEVGSVGIILLSSNNIPSTKTVESL